MSQGQPREVRSNDTAWPQFLLTIAGIAVVAGLFTTLAAQVVMEPNVEERNQVIGLLVAIGTASVAITVVFKLFSPRSLTRRMFFATVAGPIVIAAALIVGVQSMFLSDQDAEFLLILLAFTTVLGLAVTYTLARPLTRDLETLTRVAQRVGEGDLEARSELERLDEVGNLSSAIDVMIGQISSCLLYTSPSPRDRTRSRMPSSA